MDKAKSLVIVLIFVVISSSGYLYIQSSDLEKTVSDLQLQNKQLTIQNKFLEEQVENLSLRNKDVEKSYNSLLAKYINLNESYNVLLSEYNVTKILSLEDRVYFSVVKNLIAHANKSVYIAVYVIKFDVKESDDPVNQLLYALVDAHERGIDVKVLVDDPTLRSYPDTISYLKNNSIEVKLDQKKGVTSHMKIVIIDDVYLIVGSHNWTESALSYNHEYSVLVVSKYYAEEAEDYFVEIWVNGRSV